MANTKKKKKTQSQVIEASLSKNRTTVKITALKGAKILKEGHQYWPSEDDAIKFVENGWAKITDTDYEAKLLKAGKKLPKPKPQPKAKTEPVKED